MSKKQIFSVILGLCFIIVGILALGQAMHLWDASVLEQGWWALFLIVPAAASIILKGPRLWNIVLVVLGVLLFAEGRGWLGDIVWELVPGAALLLLGGRIIARKGEPRQRRHTHSCD